MTTRILVPFSRPHLLPELIDLWEKERGKQVAFVPIHHEPIGIRHELDSTIYPFFCDPVPENWNAMYWKLNYLLDQLPICNEDRYGFLCDDDAYEPGFFDKLNRLDDDVIIVSMKRGNRCPPGGNGHPPTTLIAQKENIKIGSVGMEQLFIRGKLLKNYRFKNFAEADGDLICRVVNDHKPKYLANAFIYFNYFEPGRWS